MGQTVSKLWVHCSVSVCLYVFLCVQGETKSKFWAVPSLSECVYDFFRTLWLLPAATPSSPSTSTCSVHQVAAPQRMFVRPVNGLIHYQVHPVDLSELFNHSSLRYLQLCIMFVSSHLFFCSFLGFIMSIMTIRQEFMVDK